jgi:hypothetical protein
MAADKNDLMQVQVGKELDVVQPALPVKTKTDIGVMYGTEIVAAAPLAPQSQAGNRSLSLITRRHLSITPADPQERFTPMLDERRTKRVDFVHRMRAVQEAVGGGIALMSMPLSAGIGISILNHQGAANLGVGFEFLGVVMGAGAVLGANTWRLFRTADRDSAGLYRLGAERFAAWLYERHGIKVDVDQTAQALGYELAFERELEGESYFKFKAEDGSRYAFVGDGHHFHVERYVPKSKKSKKKAMRKELDLKPLLQGNLFSNEAAMLIEQIGERLMKLRDVPLSSEQQHVTKRVQEDVLGLAKLNENLHKIDRPSAADEQHFASTLLQLRDELQEVLSQQHAALSSEVEVTARYVKDRQQRPSASDLNLEH